MCNDSATNDNWLHLQNPNYYVIYMYYIPRVYNCKYK